MSIKTVGKAVPSVAPSQPGHAQGSAALSPPGKTRPPHVSTPLIAAVPLEARGRSYGTVSATPALRASLPLPVTASTPSVSRLSSAGQAVANAGQAISSAAAAVGSGIAEGSSRVGNAAMQTAGQVGAQLAQGYGAAASALASAAQQPVVGHLIQQTVAVGGPTVARELLATGVQAVMASHPTATLATQGVLSVGLSVLQGLRHHQEARDPDEAARAAHALSPEQWAASSPEQQQQMRDAFRQQSLIVTGMQVAASLTTMGLSAAAVASGDGREAARLLAADVKTVAFSAVRDGVSASMSMTGMSGETQGLNAADMNRSATAYLGHQLASMLATPVALGVAAPRLGEANDRLVMGQGTMGRAEAWGSAAKGALVNALVNTAIETADSHRLSGMEAKAAGVEQTLAPRITGQDYSRLLDHTLGRVSVVSGSNAVDNAVNALIGMSPRVPAGVASAVAGLASNAFGRMTYATVGKVWQGEAAVRASHAAADRQPAPIAEP